MKRTPLGPGEKSVKRGSTFAAKPKPLKTRKRLKRSKGLRKVNPKRKAKKAEEHWGPEGGGGPYATILRARPSDATGKGWAVHRSNWQNLESLALAPQCVFAHVRDRGMGGEKGKWWDGISLTWEEHQEVHDKGWGSARPPALMLAHALAWAAHDAGIVPEPGVERPDVPAGEDDTAVEHYQSLLRSAWPHRTD